MQLQFLVYVLTLLLAIKTPVEAWPVDGVETAESSSGTVNDTKNVTAVEEEQPTPAQQSTDLEAAGSEEANNQYVGAVGTVMIPDQSVAATNTFNPGNYEEYINPYGAIPYGPYGAPYPAPVGYAPLQAYPSPYVMQTGTEGYLVPTAVTTSTSDSTSTSTSSGVVAFLNALFPSLMVSTAFRVIAGIVSALGVVLFGGAITTAICSFTPLCDITFRAVTYMRRKGTAERVGKIIAEDLTPERVRRATEFVWKAIRKYKELQKSVDESDTQ